MTQYQDKLLHEQREADDEKRSHISKGDRLWKAQKRAHAINKIQNANLEKLRKLSKE